MGISAVATAGCTALYGGTGADVEAPGREYAYRHERVFRVAGQTINPIHWRRPRRIVYDSEGVIYWEGPNGASVTQVADHGGALNRVCWSPDRTRTVIVDGETAKLYESLEAVGGEPLATHRDVRAPINELVPIWNPGDDRNDAIIWAEYHVEEGRDHIVWKSRVGCDDEPGFDDVLRVDAAEFRHFHSLDHDPFNPGHLWVTAGDGDGNCAWYRTTDHGETWAQLDKPDTAIYQTLRLTFTEEYVYWAMDRGAHNSDVDAYAFMRARRDALDRPEIISEIDRDGGLLSYGTAYIDGLRPGILVTTRAVSAYEGDTIPLHFFDLHTDTLVRIANVPIDSDASDRSGITRTLPYSNRDGSLSVSLRGIPRLETRVPHGQSTAFLEPHWVELHGFG